MLVFVMTAVAVHGVLSHPVTAQPVGDNPVLYAGSGVTGTGGSVMVDLVVLLGSKSGMDEFDLTLTFDPDVVAPGRIALDPEWLPAESGAPPSTAGELTLSAVHSEGGCLPSASCHLATIEFVGTSDGESVLAAGRVSLMFGGMRIAEAASVAGRIQVRMSGITAETAVAGASVEAIREPGDTSPGEVRPASSGLDTGMAAILVLLLGIPAILLAGSAFVVAVARRSWAWSGRRKAPAPPAVLFRADASALSAEVAEYLSRVEAFGRVSREDEDAFLAGDVAAAFVRVEMPAPERPPSSSGQ